MDITTFLLDRVSGDYVNNPSAHWTQCPYPKGGACSCSGPLGDRNRQRIAECEAKRRMVEATVDYIPELQHGDNGEWAFDITLRLLALPYADHPDYREEWRP